MRRPAQETGVIAIFLVIILSLLLLGTTISASRLNVSALSQSTQINQSDLSYYAAEAGVQDASRRIDNNPGFTDLFQIFPEQYCGGSSTAPQVGDWADLENSDGTPAWTASNGPHVYTEPTNGCTVNQGPNPDPGAVSWHDRRVYNAGLNPSGTLEKDQTIQIDTTSLCDPTISPNCDTVDQTAVHNNFNEMDFCFTPNDSGLVGVNSSNEQIELTSASYSNATIGTSVPVSVYKHIFPVAGGAGFPAAYTDPNGVTYNEVVPPAAVGFSTCVTASISDHSQRFIFRPRLLLNQAQAGNSSVTQNQSAITANYKVYMLGDACNNDLASTNCIYVQNDIFFIDVVGQSGNIRRRIVAEKLHNGQLLGVFDFLLYSGDKVIPLCKAGVNTSYNNYSQQCLATSP